MKNDTTPVIDADIIEEEIPEDEQTPVTPTATDGGADVILSLEQMIKANVRLMNKNKVELKKYREMIESALQSNDSYRELDEAAKKAAKLKGAMKMNIMQQPENREVAGKIKELSAETKELSDGLSDYLREYARMSGTNEIEGDDGEVQEIIYIAKLIKKASGSRKN